MKRLTLHPLESESLKLPLQFEVKRLQQEISQFHSGDWHADSTGVPGQSTIILTAVGGTWNQDFAISGPMEPTSYLQSCPYLQQVMQALNLPLSRSRLVCLAEETEVEIPAEYNYHWFRRISIYIPLLVSPGVEVLSNGKRLPMQVGKGLRVDPFQTHKVVNSTDRNCIYLVIETKRPAREGKFLNPLNLQDSPNPLGTIPLESYKFEVLTPQEMESLTQVLLSELEKTSISQAEFLTLKENIETFRMQWEQTFSRSGHHPTGELAYQDLLLGFKEKVVVKANKWLSSSGEGKKAVAIINSMLLLANRSSSKKVNKRLLARKKKRVKPAFHWDASYRAELGLLNSQPELKELQLLYDFRSASTPNQVWESFSSQGEMTQEEFGKKVQRFIERDLLRENFPDLEFDRPLFIVSAPRAGSTLLFETLCQFPDLWTIGMESHEIIEQFPDLRPSAQDFQSNRLTESDASAPIISRLRNAFVRQLRNREGQGYLNLPISERPRKIRFLEKTPKNALRIPFLKAVFPQARFIYLYREPKANISSMIEGWRSRCFVSYRQLPGWPFKEWNFLLTPGWSAYKDASVAEIAAYQWKTANAYILEDLQTLPASSWCLVDYQDLVQKPKETITKISNFAGLHWDSHVEQRVSQSLPTSTVTLSAPSPDKWRKHAQELATVLPSVEPIINILEKNYDYCAS